jgi:hypothetical protein
MTTSTQEPGISRPVQAARAIPQRRNLVIPLGLVLVALGLLASAALLEKTILPDGLIPHGSRKALALGLCRIALVMFGALLLWKRPKLTAVHLAAVALMGAVTLLLGTLVLQVFYKPPQVVSGWRSFAPPAERNEFGFRGRPIKYSADDFVIVLVGDSQVEAMALPMDQMPEARLESHLNALGTKVKVFSLGAGGYGQDQELLVLEEYLKKYRADLVVLWQTPWNDVWNNVFNTHMFSPNPKPTFWLDKDGSLRGPSEAMGHPMANSRFVLAAIWQRVIGLPKRDKDWENSLPPAYVPLDHCDGPVKTEWQERWKSNRGRMHDENLATEKSHMAIMLSPRSKRMQYGLDLTRALTKHIEEVTKAQNGKLAIFQTDENSFDSDGDQIYILNGKYFRVSKHQFEENWKYVNDGFAAQVFPITEKDWRVGPDDGHLNQAANDQVMGDLARWLRPQIRDKKPQVSRL